MHLIELAIHRYLEEVKQGKVTIPPLLSQTFVTKTEADLHRQIERQPRQFTIRMSSIGRPLCQLQFEQLGYPTEIHSTDIIRNLYGDISEAILMFLLHAAGVPIVAEQEPVELEIAGITMGGTLDIVIDFGDGPKIWDIKSASGWAFKNKYSNTSFEEFYRNDNFGYVEQLFLYAEGYSRKTNQRAEVGGICVLSKDDGKIGIIEAPREQQLLRERVLREVKANVGVLSATNPSRLASGILGSTITESATTGPNKPRRCFQPVPEYFRGKPTGNTLASIACQYCPFKFDCWDTIALHPKAKSKAKNVEMTWYIDYNENQLSQS